MDLNYIETLDKEQFYFSDLYITNHVIIDTEFPVIGISKNERIRSYFIRYPQFRNNIIIKQSQLNNIISLIPGGSDDEQKVLYYKPLVNLEIAYVEKQNEEIYITNILEGQIYNIIDLKDSINANFQKNKALKIDGIYCAKVEENTIFIDETISFK